MLTCADDCTPCRPQAVYEASMHPDWQGMNLTRPGERPSGMVEFGFVPTGGSGGGKPAHSARKQFHHKMQAGCIGSSWLHHDCRVHFGLILLALVDTPWSDRCIKKQKIQGKSDLFWNCSAAGLRCTRACSPDVHA